MACLVFRNRSSLRLGGGGSLPFRNVLLEHPGVGANELFDRLRRLPADALDDIGLGTEDAVLVILCDGDEMRRQVVGKPRVFHKSLAPGLDGDVHILDRLPQRTARLVITVSPSTCLLPTGQLLPALWQRLPVIAQWPCHRGAEAREHG